jgi:hypothetical protein
MVDVVRDQLWIQFECDYCCKTVSKGSSAGWYGCPINVVKNKVNVLKWVAVAGMQVRLLGNVLAKILVDLFVESGASSRVVALSVLFFRESFEALQILDGREKA